MPCTGIRRHARSMTTLTIDLLLEALWESKGTDLLLSQGNCPMVRIDGDLQPLAAFGKLEDPIEYVHEDKRALVSQREVGTDTPSFPQALRAALREDPDVLLVGEMRDLESIQFALSLAETGHLVFATLHTNDSAQALDRIVDVFPSDRQAQIRVQLANALTGIIYQRLVPEIGGGQIAAFEVL